MWWMDGNIPPSHTHTPTQSHTHTQTETHTHKDTYTHPHTHTHLYCNLFPNGSSCFTGLKVSVFLNQMICSCVCVRVGLICNGTGRYGCSGLLVKLTDSICVCQMCVIKELTLLCGFSSLGPLPRPSPPFLLALPIRGHVYPKSSFNQ